MQRYMGILEMDWLSAGLALFLGLVLYTGTSRNSPFGDIPAIGGSGLISSWFGAVRAATKGHKMIEEGYRKYKKGVFRVPEIQRWRVIVSEKQRMEEMLKAPDDVLSMSEAIKDGVAADYIFGKNSFDEAYHVGVVRGALNRHLGEIYPELHDEIIHGFEDALPVTDEWIKVNAVDTFLRIVSRATQRILLGLPKCRDEDYLDINVRFSQDAFLGGQFINLFPTFLKPLVSRLIPAHSTIRRCLKHLKPIIEERQRQIDEHGFDYPDKPNDLLSWLMDEAKGEERTIKYLTMRVMVINFAALHTSTMSFTHALYHLAARPQYIEPLREEVEAVIAEEGWSKAAIARMRKLDSFFKESLRVSGNGASVERKALKPFTFSDGLQIPKDAVLSAAFIPRIMDDEANPGGSSFDGFRFSNRGEDATTQFAASSMDWLHFGYGRHACPGRFFAATEVKTMMAHLLLTYDVKLENEGVRPEDAFFFFTCIPDAKAKVLFRRRQV